MQALQKFCYEEWGSYCLNKTTLEPIIMYSAQQRIADHFTSEEAVYTEFLKAQKRKTNLFIESEWGQIELRQTKYVKTFKNSVFV